MDDVLEQWRAAILTAQQHASPLRIRGAGTKDFYGHEFVGGVLDTRAHSGIVHHEPTELVVTVRAGTPWCELVQALDAHQQYLPFEPPFVDQGATVGGVINAGLTGVARLSSGGIRDYVLGAHLMNAKGDLLKFGGQVMKNVAGYDVSRLLVGSMGTLGLMTQVSLKLLPQPKSTLTMRVGMDFSEAQKLCRRFLVKPIAVTGTAWFDGELTVRLAGMDAAVVAGEATLLLWASEFGAQFKHLDAADAVGFWHDLNEQSHAYFTSPSPEHELWRVVLPSAVDGLSVLEHTGLAMWGGSLRWLWLKSSERDATDLMNRCQQVGGHAVRYRSSQLDGLSLVSSIEPQLMALQHAVKSQFDPKHIFNRNRLGANPLAASQTNGATHVS